MLHKHQFLISRYNLKQCVNQAISGDLNRLCPRYHFYQDQLMTTSLETDEQKLCECHKKLNLSRH